MNKIIEVPNYLIEGMSITNLEFFLEELVLKDNRIKDIFDKHQMKYITRFFSDSLQEKGIFIKGVTLKDLLNLYYIDNKIKKEILSYTQDVNRYLNVVIINQYELGNISLTTGDRENSFEAIASFYGTMSQLEQYVVMESFNKIHKTNHKKINSFLENLLRVVRLQNFTNHHYSLFSFEYASIIKNGESHAEKDGIIETLEEAMTSLSLFINKKSFGDFIISINSCFKGVEFSNNKISCKIKNDIYEKLNYNAFK